MEELTEGYELGSCSKAKDRVIANLAQGQTAIFLSGRIFEQNEKVYLQSSITLPEVNENTVTWPLDVDSQTVRSSLPHGDILFSTREVSSTLVATLRDGQHKLLKVHESASASSPSWNLSDDPNQHFSYTSLAVPNDLNRMFLPNQNHDE